MRVSLRHFVAISFCFLVACEAPVGPRERGTLTVSFQTSRTVVANLEAERYEVSLTNAKGETTSGSGEQTVVFDDLEAGVWTISAVALSSSDSVVASGSTSVDLTEGPASVVVPLATSQVGTGTFSFTFTAPSTLGILSVRMTLLRGGTVLGEVSFGQSDLPEDPKQPGRFLTTITNDHFTGSPIASGTYLLLLTFLGADDLVLGSHAEAVNVWDNVESNAWLDPEGNLLGRRDFGVGEFASSSAVPADLVVQGTESPVTFSPSTFDYTFQSQGGAFSVTADQGTPGQRLQYRIEEGPWSDLRWGETLEVDVETAVQVVLRVTAPDRSTFLDYNVIDGYQVTKIPYGPEYAPETLTGDEQGNLYVVDSPGGSIWKLSPSGAATVYIASQPSKGEFVLEDPVGIVRDGAGNLYVSERNLGRIKKIATDLQVTELPIGNDLADPNGLALSDEGYLFIANGGKEQVVVHRLSDGAETVIPLGGRTPLGLVFDESRGLLSITCADGAVMSYDTDQQTLTTLWSEPGSSPYGVALDDEGNLYVCLTAAHRIVKITPGGLATTVVGDGTAEVSAGFGTKAKVKQPYQIFRSTEGVFSFTEYGEPSVRTIR